MGTTSRLNRVRPGVPKRRKYILPELLPAILMDRIAGNRHARRRAVALLRKEFPNASDIL